LSRASTASAAFGRILRAPARTRGTAVAVPFAHALAILLASSLVLSLCVASRRRGLRRAAEEAVVVPERACKVVTIDPSIGDLPPATDKIVKVIGLHGLRAAQRRGPGVVGQNGRYRVAAGQNLLDIAREGGLGFRELRDANPKIDEWEPKAGVELVLPTRRILPRPTALLGPRHQHPEFRLYMFPSTPSSASARPS
jgi:hypothetical protein